MYKKSYFWVGGKGGYKKMFNWGRELLLDKGRGDFKKFYVTATGIEATTT